MWTPLNDLDKIPDIVDTKTKWLAVLSKFHPPPIFCVFGHLVSMTKNGWTKIMLLNTFVSCVQCLSCNATANYVKNNKKWMDKNNAPEHLCFMCPMSFM